MNFWLDIKLQIYTCKQRQERCFADLLDQYKVESKNTQTAINGQLVKPTFRPLSRQLNLLGYCVDIWVSAYILAKLSKNGTLIS